MPGNGTVVDFSGTLGDRCHSNDLPASLGPALRLTGIRACPQMRYQLSSGLSTPLDEKRLVDLLVARTHGLVIGIQDRQHRRDLLQRRPIGLQQARDYRREAPDNLGRPRTLTAL